MYKAFNNILLNEGFKVQSGATFLAEVGGGDVTNIECLTPEGTLNSIVSPHNPNDLNSLEPTKLGMKNNSSTTSIVESDLDKLALPEQAIKPFLSIHPNPFNKTFDIELSLNEEAVASIQIFNSYGQIMESVLENQYLYSGIHTWNVANDDLIKGVYYCYLTIDGEKEVRRIIKN